MLYVLKGLSMAQRLVSKTCQLPCLTIPHRDYFNFFSAKNSEKNRFFFCNYFFPAEDGKKLGYPKKFGVPKKFGAMDVKLRGGRV